MAEDKPISESAAGLVARKLEQFERAASSTSGRWPELFHQHFTDHVDRFAGRIRDPQLREYLLNQAEGTGQYLGRENRGGRFEYDSELDALRWRGETPDAWKKVDFEGQWVRKSEGERARYVTGHFGEDSRTQNDYPGVQVEKNGVVGKIRWGPEQPTGQDAQEFAEGMLDRHLGFEAPKIRPSSLAEIRKAAAMSERLGAEVLTKPYRKYIKECAKAGESPAKKYGGTSESVEGELSPQRRSR